MGNGRMRHIKISLTVAGSHRKNLPLTNRNVSPRTTVDSAILRHRHPPYQTPAGEYVVSEDIVYDFSRSRIGHNTD